MYKKAGDDVVKVLARRASACEKRSVDEVAIDITQASRLMLQREDLHALIDRARGTHLAGVGKRSEAAAQISADDTRRGHRQQQKGGGDEGETEDNAEEAFWARGLGLWSEEEEMLVAGAAVTHHCNTL
jgi:hypothetical protein